MEQVHKIGKTIEKDCLRKMCELEGKTTDNSRERPTYTALGARVRKWKGKGNNSMSGQCTPSGMKSITSFTSKSNK